MSYTSKRNIAGILAGVALIVAYVIYAMGTNAPAQEDSKAWAVAILVFIGIFIGVQIVMQIVFHIALSIGIAIKEEMKAGDKDSAEVAERIIKAEMVEDEWTKTVSLKASRVAGFIMALGIVTVPIVLAIGLKTATALHLLFGLFVIAAISQEVASMVMTERGVK